MSVYLLPQPLSHSESQLLAILHISHRTIELSCLKAIMPISIRPPYLSAIMPINHYHNSISNHTSQPSWLRLSTIMPIGHHAYLPSCLSISSCSIGFNAILLLKMSSSNRRKESLFQWNEKMPNHRLQSHIRHDVLNEKKRC